MLSALAGSVSTAHAALVPTPGGCAAVNAGKFNLSSDGPDLNAISDFVAVVLEPSARVHGLFESQAAYVDSLGTAQAARSFSAGRASAGGKLLSPMAIGGGTTLTPYAGIFADYHFSSDDAVPTGQPEFAISDGVSARVVSGVTLGFGSGTRLGLDREYGGLGSGGSSMWSIGGRGSLPS